MNKGITIPCSDIAFEVWIVKKRVKMEGGVEIERRITRDRKSCFILYAFYFDSICLLLMLLERNITEKKKKKKKKKKKNFFRFKWGEKWFIYSLLSNLIIYGLLYDIVWKS